MTFSRLIANAQSKDVCVTKSLSECFLMVTWVNRNNTRELTCYSVFARNDVRYFNRKKWVPEYRWCAWWHEKVYDQEISKAFMPEEKEFTESS